MCGFVHDRGELVYIDEDHGLKFDCEPDCKFACSDLTVNEKSNYACIFWNSTTCATFVGLCRKQTHLSS